MNERAEGLEVPLMPLSSVWAGDAVNRHLESVCGVGALADIDQPSERIWAAQLVATLLAAQGIAVDHRTQTAIDETLTSLAAAPREQRTLTLLATQLGSRQRALRDALRPYTLEGNFGQIFDADRDDVPTGPGARRHRERDRCAEPPPALLRAAGDHALPQHGRAAQQGADRAARSNLFPAPSDDHGGCGG